MKDWYKIVQQGDMPVITIYGAIMPESDGDNDESVSYAQFQAAFRDLERTYVDCRILMNCMGGSLIEGLPIYDMVVNSPMNVEIVVEGTAASFAAILVQAGDKRSINANGFMMIHAASGGIFGDTSTIRNYADSVDLMQKRTKVILMERTGQSEAVVDSWLQPGLDTWFDADMCLSLNLVDEIIPAQAKRVIIPVTQLAKRKGLEAYQFIQNQLLIENSNMNKLKASLVVMLALAGVRLSIEDSDEKFADEVEKLFKAKNDAIDKVAEDNATAIITMSKVTVTPEEQKELVAFGKTNPKGLVTMLAKMPGAAQAAAAAGTTIVQIGVKRENAGGDEAADDRSKWTFDDWSKKDAKGLATMQAGEPDKFNKLVAQVGTHLKNVGAIS